jgi:hypothetical protein
MSEADDYRQELSRKANSQVEFTWDRTMPRRSNENLTAKNALQRPDTVKRNPGKLPDERKDKLPTRLLIA